MAMPIDIRRDMLTLTSTVQEVLRALYLYGVDYIVLFIGKNERLFHKEQLVALLEQGRDTATLEDIASMVLGEPLSAKMRIEEISPSAEMLLFFTASGGDGQGELDKMTFEEFRERKIADSTVIFPDWWSIPLSLVHIDEDRVFLNPQGERVIPGGASSLANQIERMRTEKMVSIKDKKTEKTFALSPLTENTFLAEDISGDFEMAEDLVWWAAIGKAFVGRMKDNGLVVKRLSPYEDPPADAAEVIECSWEGELIGRLAIEVPGQAAGEVDEKAISEQADERLPADAAEHAVPMERTEPVERKEQEEVDLQAAPIEQSKLLEPIEEVEREALLPPAKPEKKTKRTEKAENSLKAEVELKEPEPENINMKKTAARSAYGLKKNTPAKDEKLPVDAAAEKIEGPDGIAEINVPDGLDKSDVPEKLDEPEAPEEHGKTSKSNVKKQKKAEAPKRSRKIKKSDTQDEEPKKAAKTPKAAKPAKPNEPAKTAKPVKKAARKIGETAGGTKKRTDAG